MCRETPNLTLAVWTFRPPGGAEGSRVDLGANKSAAEACTASDTETETEGTSRVVLVLVVEAFGLVRWASAATAGGVY